MSETANPSSTPKPVPSTTNAPQPEMPPHIPQFAPVKHPLRFAINGVQHLMQPLKDLIASDAGIPDEYKALIKYELDKKTSNGGVVHCHVLDHANGDSSIVIHIGQIKLG